MNLYLNSLKIKKFPGGPEKPNNEVSKIGKLLTFGGTTLHITSINDTHVLGRGIGRQDIEKIMNEMLGQTGRSVITMYFLKTLSTSIVLVECGLYWNHLVRLSIRTHFRYRFLSFHLKE